MQLETQPTRGRARFRQGDVVRAIKAMQVAGANGRVDIATDGTISIVIGEPANSLLAANDNTWADVDAA